jgi:hypothetical protein
MRLLSSESLHKPYQNIIKPIYESNTAIEAAGTVVQAVAASQVVISGIIMRFGI